MAERGGLGRPGPQAGWRDAVRRHAQRLVDAHPDPHGDARYGRTEPSRGPRAWARHEGNRPHRSANRSGAARRARDAQRIFRAHRRRLLPRLRRRPRSSGAIRAQRRRCRGRGRDRGGRTHRLHDRGGPGEIPRDRPVREGLPIRFECSWPRPRLHHGWSADFTGAGRQPPASLRPFDAARRKRPARWIRIRRHRASDRRLRA